MSRSLKSLMLSCFILGGALPLIVATSAATKAASNADENKAIVRRAVEVYNTGNVDLLDELIAADAVGHEGPPTPPGPATVKQFITMARSAFPDLHVNIEDMVAEGDRVAVLLTIRGTQKGAFMGIPATGKSVNFNAMDIYRIANGKIAENWSVADNLGMPQQLGVVSAPSLEQVPVATQSK